MVVDCPSCGHQILTPAGEVARFCSQCGFRLGSTAPAAPPAEAAPTEADPYKTTEYVPQADPGDDDTLPDRIGGYRVLGLLGAGGMGRVFEGESLTTGERVAIKVLTRQLVANPVSLERFKQEGKLAGKIVHPRCVFVRHVDTEDGVPFIVMERMPGRTLKDLLDERGRLQPAEAVPLMLDAIDGLLEAHRLGVIHRDFKPSNCFLTEDGRVKVGDFGLSKSLHSTIELTQTGAFLGTVLYSSPEQIRGEEVDYASDVYAVSATLYQLLAGRPPFFHENVTAVLAMIVSEDAPPLRSLRRELPRSLARLVHHGLERDRDRRLGDLRELRSRLAAQVPSTLTLGALSLRVGAYLLDELIAGVFLVLPLTVLVAGLTGTAPGDWLHWLAVGAYFAAFEGLTGAAPGKRLLGLRVCRTGSTQPPGAGRAALRILAFSAMLLLIDLGASALAAGATAPGVALVAAGLALLVLPMRRSTRYRGLHERLSGTTVLRLPAEERPIRLRMPPHSPLERLPGRDPVLPAQVGAYRLDRSVLVAPDQWLGYAEDPVLGRRVLARLAYDPPPEFTLRGELSRPGRLRSLSYGVEQVRGRTLTWEAFIAPEGVPLAPLAARQPLDWRVTRDILRQLAEELAEARADDTLPPTLGLDQVWVAGDGRVQLLDEPVGSPPAESPLPLTLLAQAAVASLEGRLRPLGAPSYVRSPIPRHGHRFLMALLGGGNAPVRTLERARADLEAMRGEPTAVTRPRRAILVGVTAALFALPALALAALIAFHHFFAALEAIEATRSLEAVYLTEPRGQGRAVGLNDPGLAQMAYESGREARRADAFHRQRLSRPERWALARVEASMAASPPSPEEVARRAKTTRATLEGRLERARGGTDPSPPPAVGEQWQDGLALSALFFGLPVLWAGLFNGGFVRPMLGMALVRADGCPAGRLRCLGREALAWLPFAAAVNGAMMLQSGYPDRGEVPLALLALAFAWLAAAAVTALLRPTRGLVDWLARTWVVPR